MVNSKKNLFKITAIISLLLLPLSINAAEVVYRIDGYNKTIQDFTIVASGLVLILKMSMVPPQATALIRYHATARLRSTLWVGRDVLSIVSLSACARIIRQDR